MTKTLRRAIAGAAAGMALAAAAVAQTDTQADTQADTGDSAATGVTGDEPASRFAVKGRGLASCEAMTTAFQQQSPERLAFAGWINGYLTGLQQAEPDTFDLAPWQPTDFLIRYTLGYCAQNPDRPYFAAVATLVRALRAFRLTAPSDLIQLQAEGRQVRFYQETLRQVEARLNDLGLAEVDADGTFTTETFAALKTFQGQHDLAATGLPDLETLLALFAADQQAPD